MASPSNKILTQRNQNPNQRLHTEPLPRGRLTFDHAFVAKKSIIISSWGNFSMLFFIVFSKL
jgi:hypothetical protein